MSKGSHTQIDENKVEDNMPQPKAQAYNLFCINQMLITVDKPQSAKHIQIINIGNLCTEQVHDMQFHILLTRQNGAPKCMCRVPQRECRAVLHRVHLFPHTSLAIKHQYLLVGCQENAFTSLTYGEDARNKSFDTSKTHRIHQMPLLSLIIFQHPNFHPSI